MNDLKSLPGITLEENCLDSDTFWHDVCQLCCMKQLSYLLLASVPLSVSLSVCLQKLKNCWSEVDVIL